MNPLLAALYIQDTTILNLTAATIAEKIIATIIVENPRL
jgi:hypothetical protein